MQTFVGEGVTLSRTTSFSLVDPNFVLSTKTLGQVLETITNLEHLHLDIAQENNCDRENFLRTALTIVESTLSKNKNTLASITTNACSFRIIEAISSLPNLKVLVLTIPDTFEVMLYGMEHVRGEWPSLEVAVIKLQCFDPLRPRFVQAFTDDTFPSMTSLAIIGSTPCCCVHAFLESHPSLDRLSFVTPDERFPFPPSYDFIMPPMNSLVELCITSRHYSYFCKNTQPFLITLILYDEELPEVPFLLRNRQFLLGIYSSHAFPLLQYLVVRSTIDKYFELKFKPVDSLLV